MDRVDHRRRHRAARLARARRTARPSHVTSRDPGWWGTIRRIRRLSRRLEPWTPEPPVPPPLPPGGLVNVPGRGEVFVRRLDGAPGAIPILLLHGWTSAADLTWWRVYERLGTLGSVIALDHRGHGRGIRSDERFTLEDAADDAAGVLRELGL